MLFSFVPSYHDLPKMYIAGRLLLGIDFGSDLEANEQHLRELICFCRVGAHEENVVEGDEVLIITKEAVCVVPSFHDGRRLITTAIVSVLHARLSRHFDGAEHNDPSLQMLEDI